jgi:NTE family protein
MVTRRRRGGGRADAHGIVAAAPQDDSGLVRTSCGSMRSPVDEALREALEPVREPSPAPLVPGDSVDAPEHGTALCLSGGGYLAMLFHSGALWRLNEAGYLPRLDRVSSVSAGSMTAGVLAMNWSKLAFDADGVGRGFGEAVIRPIRTLAGTTIDLKAVLLGLFLPGSIGDRYVSALARYLFGETALGDLPDRPRFVINATNLQSAVLWRFEKSSMRDHRVGEIPAPTMPLARAVAASGAFPPFISPVTVTLDDASYTAGSGDGLQRPPFTTNVVLSDGGVYDNLGLETAWKRCRTILISDAGARIAAEPRPHGDWPRQTRRVLNVIDSQVRALRKRQAVGSLRLGLRDGAYWGIGTDIANYGLTDALPCPHEQTLLLARHPRRLAKMTPLVQERVINWGYAVADAALRRHVDQSIAPPQDFPYPNARVG